MNATLGLAATALGSPVSLVCDHSWSHGESTVLEVHDADGTPWIAKRHTQHEGFEREVAAHPSEIRGGFSLRSHHDR